jgi:hypothetical protein
MYFIFFMKKMGNFSSEKKNNKIGHEIKFFKSAGRRQPLLVMAQVLH